MGGAQLERVSRKRERRWAEAREYLAGIKLGLVHQVAAGYATDSPGGQTRRQQDMCSKLRKASDRALLPLAVPGTASVLLPLEGYLLT